MAASSLLLAPYLAAESIRDLLMATHARTTWLGVALAGSSLALMPLLARAKWRLGTRVDSAATAAEGTQNILCAYLAAAVLAGLLGNALLGAWWLDPAAGLAIAGVAARRPGAVARRVRLLLVAHPVSNGAHAASTLPV